LDKAVPIRDDLRWLPNEGAMLTAASM